MRRTSFALLLAGCLLAAPASASAGQIVYHQDAAAAGASESFGVMNDDGSGQRTWLNVSDVPPSGGQQFTVGASPKISADGRRVVFTTATEAYKEPGCSGLGARYSGVNVWDAGVVRRLSPPPAAAPNMTTFESDGSPVVDGRIYYSSIGITYSCTAVQSSYGGLRFFSPDGSDGGAFEAACTGIALGTGGIAVNPVDPSVLAYGGCNDPATGRGAIYVGASGGAADTVVRVAPVSTDQFSSSAGSPVWRPDGGRIISLEQDGGGPDQLVAYPPDGSGAVRMTIAPAGTSITEPVFVGNDTVAFTAAFVSGATVVRNIYALPASCSDCPFASATPLTTDGRSSSPSWTPAALYTAPPPPAPPAPLPPVPVPTKKVSKASALRSARVVKTKRGLAIKLTLRRTATVTFKVAGVKPKRKARRTTRKLKKGTRTIRLTTVAKTRLRKGSYRVTVGLRGSKRTIRLSGRIRR